MLIRITPKKSMKSILKIFPHKEKRKKPNVEKQLYYITLLF